MEEKCEKIMRCILAAVNAGHTVTIDKRYFEGDGDWIGFEAPHYMCLLTTPGSFEHMIENLSKGL